MIHFIRHSQTDYNVAKRLAGGDVEACLTPDGEEKTRQFAIENADFLAGLQTLVVSPQVRARRTAEILLPHCDSRIRMDTEEGLREWILGEWSGKSYDEVPDLFTDPPPDPKGGETFQAFENRVFTTLSNIAQRPERRILIVAHGGVWFVYARRAAHENRDIGNCALESMDRDALSAMRPEDTFLSARRFALS